MHKSNKNLLRRAFAFIAVILTISCFQACQDDPDEMIAQKENLSDAALLEHILEMGFDQSQIEENEDFFLVEGDIYFAKEDLMRPDHGVLEEQASTNNLIAHGVQGNITVSIANSMPTSGVDNWRPEIQQAINNWNAVSCSRIGLSLVNGVADITIQSDGNTLGDNVIAAASFPSGGRPGNIINVNLDFLGNQNVPTGRKLYNIVHEIGHCLGFRHTNWASRGEGTGSVGANYIPATPVTDNNSVMNGGTALNQWSGFSNFDQIALRNIYPALTTTCPAGLFRYYNSGNGDHFYTTNFAELGSGRGGYVLEGIQAHIYGAQASGTVPLYRYYNNVNGDHFYTTNFSELGNGSGGYVLEGIQGYVFSSSASGRVPLYRYYNGGNGDHFYTTNFSELGSGGGGYNYEGIQCYVLP